MTKTDDRVFGMNAGETHAKPGSPAETGNGEPRVLHLSTSFPGDTDDSAGAFVYRLVEAQRRMGIQVGVLTPASTRPTGWLREYVRRFRYAPWPLQNLAQQPGGIPASLRQNPFRYALVPGFLLAMGSELVRLSREFDLIHAHWSVSGAVAVLIGRIHRRPVVTTLRGSDQYRSGNSGFYDRIHRTALNGSAFVVGVSESIVSEVREREPKLAARTMSIANGVDDGFFSVRPSRWVLGNRLKILVVGSLVVGKAVDVALDALAALSAGVDWELTIAGAGPEQARLRDQVRRTRLNQRVHFLGRVAPSRMAALMAQHHLLLHPSAREGRPNVVLEAMAAALPIVASDIDGTRELVQHGRTGWLFAAGDAAALSRLLITVLQDDGNLSRAGGLGRQWMIDSNLRWEHTAQQYSRLYRAVVSGKGSS